MWVQEVFTKAERKYNFWNNGTFLKKHFPKAFEKRKLAFESASAKKEELEQKLEATTIHAQIEMDSVQAELFFKMRDTFTRLQQCVRIWDIQAQREVDRLRERTNVTRSVKRTTMQISLGNTNFLKWEQDVPHICNSKGGDIFLYPGFILYRASNTAFSLIDYHDVKMQCGSTSFTDYDTNEIPSDAKIIGYRWLKENKDGSPDRRFAANRQIPVAEFGGITLTSDHGLWEDFLFSNAEYTKLFGSAYYQFVQSFKSNWSFVPPPEPAESPLQLQDLPKNSLPAPKPSFIVPCPHCGKELDLTNCESGTKIACPACSGHIEIE